MSEMKMRADEARKVAKSCETVRDFSLAMGLSMETALHWNSELGLDLPPISERKGAAREGRPVPKPAKPKAKT